MSGEVTQRHELKRELLSVLPESCATNELGFGIVTCKRAKRLACELIDLVISDGNDFESIKKKFSDHVSSCTGQVHSGSKCTGTYNCGHEDMPLYADTAGMAACAARLVQQD